MEQDKSKQVEYYFDGQTASNHSSESSPSKERRRAKRVNNFRSDSPNLKSETRYKRMSATGPNSSEKNRSKI